GCHIRVQNLNRRVQFEPRKDYLQYPEGFSMRLKSSFLSLMAATLLTTPAFAQGHHATAHGHGTTGHGHLPAPVENLIVCDTEDDVLDQGGFGRFVHSAHGNYA